MECKCSEKELLTEVRQDIKKILQRTAKLEVKSGVWGLIGGAIPSTITIIIILFKKMGE